MTPCQHVSQCESRNQRYKLKSKIYHESTKGGKHERREFGVGILDAIFDWRRLAGADRILIMFFPVFLEGRKQ
jgi:hypothetical protein